MRIAFEFTFDNELIIPLNYNYILQGFIYDNIINKKIRDFIHNEGFEYNKRHYKLFTFSRLMGKYKIENNNKMIKYVPPIALEVSSHCDDFFIDFSAPMLKNELTLYDQKIYLENLKVKSPEMHSDAKIRMLSPVVIYSTNEDKKTYYYEPSEEKFCKLITENLKNKYQAFYEINVDNINFSIYPYMETQRKIVTNYKNFVIKGWMGDYLIKGDLNLINFAYNTGIGGKNSQGFGCFEFV